MKEVLPRYIVFHHNQRESIDWGYYYSGCFHQCIYTIAKARFTIITVNVVCSFGRFYCGQSYLKNAVVI
jgi:hypothetical protein